MFFNKTLFLMVGAGAFGALLAGVTPRALPPAPVDEHIRVPAPTALTHEPVRPTARCQILLAGLFGGELALKLAQTLGEGGPGAHAYTTYRGVLKQPEKQKPAS